MQTHNQTSSINSIHKTHNSRWHFISRVYITSQIAFVSVCVCARLYHHFTLLVRRIVICVYVHFNGSLFFVSTLNAAWLIFLVFFFRLYFRSCRFSVHFSVFCAASPIYLKRVSASLTCVVVVFKWIMLVNVFRSLNIYFTTNFIDSNRIYIQIIISRWIAYCFRWEKLFFFTRQPKLWRCAIYVCDSVKINGEWLL